MRYELVTQDQIPCGSAAVALLLRNGTITGAVLERQEDGLLVETTLEGPASIIEAFSIAMGRGFGPTSTLVVAPCELCWPDSFPELVDMTAFGDTS